MTRFARAKGSKASNERVPEEPTPWSQMKQQLLERQTDENDKDKRKEFEALRQENYNKFLKELSNKSENSSWADFPETSRTSKHENKNSVVKTKKGQSETKIKTPKIDKKSKSKQLKNDCRTTKTDGNESLVLKKQLKKQKAEKNQQTEKSERMTKVNKIEKLDAKSKKIKKAKKNSDIDNEIAQMCKNLDPEMKSRYKNLKSLIEEKLQKETDIGNDFEEILSDEDNNTKDEELEDKDVQNSAQLILEPEDDKQYNNRITDIDISNKNKSKEFIIHKTSQSQKVKDKNSKEDTRKKLDEKKEFIYNMNGEKEELVKFDGFPIRKSDADRLKSLKSDMISKGIPRSEIYRTLKLERRRVEKALTRFRKHVCFHCRKSGHLLSSCPNLNSESGPIETSAIGICFKCGSTEHTHINCKVTKKDDFKFAECFICKEQGHISRQCPDNPRGLYPAGGSCRLCGDVTHLKKDCPKTMQEKADQQFTLDVISDNIEMEVSDEKQKPKNKHSKQKKIIKF